MQRKSTRVAGWILLAIVLGLPATAGPSDAQAAFERFKALEGQWSGKNGHGKTVTLDYEVVGNGSAVYERIEIEDEGTMVTMYRLDGGELLLDHYCMVGNQPRMRAVAFDGDTVGFELVSVGNLASKDAGHMARALFRFDGSDRLHSAWTFREKGADAFTATIDIERASRQARAAAR